MELNQLEVRNIEKTLAKAEEMQLLELNELQLSFVGGGIGETAV